MTGHPVKPLIRQGAGSISVTCVNIAAKCGYGTTSYFIHAFRKQAGMIPQQYRRLRRYATEPVQMAAYMNQ